MITTDSKEQSKVPIFLTQLGVPTERKSIPVGDYVILGPTHSAVVTLKSADDFLTSINNKHLNDEIYNMCVGYSRCVFIVYGCLEDALVERKVKRETYFQYLAGLTVHTVDTGERGTVSVLNFSSDFDVALYLKTLHDTIVTDDIYRSPSVKKVKVTPETRALLTVGRLPHCGPKRSLDLLEKYRTIRKVFNLTPEQFEEMPHVGKKIATQITEFLDRDFTIVPAQEAEPPSSNEIFKIIEQEKKE